MSSQASGSSIHFAPFCKWVKEHKRNDIDSQQLEAALKEIQRADKDLTFNDLMERVRIKNWQEVGNPAWEYVHSSIDWQAIKDGEERENIVPLIEENLADLGNKIKEFDYQLDESRKLRTINTKEAKQLNDKLLDVRINMIQAADKAIDVASQAEEETVILKLDQIVEPKNPLRKDLDLQHDGFQDSVAAHQLVPIIVRPIGNDTYEIVIGHRRYAALKAAGRTEIKATIRYNIPNDLQAVQMRWEENIHRSDLAPMEIAKGLENLMLDYHFKTQKEVADFLHIPEKWVSDHLIVYHDPDARQLVERVPKSLSAAVEIKHAEKDLYKYQKKALIDKTEQKHLSARQVREKAHEMMRSNIESKPPPHCVFCGRPLIRDPRDPRGKRLQGGHFRPLCDTCEERGLQEHSANSKLL